GEIDSALGCAALRIVAQRRSIALAVVSFAERVERRPVHAEQRRQPVSLAEPVEIDQQAHDAIAEAMAHRLQPRMHDVAEIKRGGIFGSFVSQSEHCYSAACTSSGGGSSQGDDATCDSDTDRP